MIYIYIYTESVCLQSTIDILVIQLASVVSHFFFQKRLVHGMALVSPKHCHLLNLAIKLACSPSA